MSQCGRYSSPPYLGRAPGDLPEIPNKGYETWLTDTTLVFIFMEVVPGIAAVIICFLALTVVSVGISLLCKYICLLYSRRRTKRKRLRKRRRTKSSVFPAEETSESEMEPVSTVDPDLSPLKAQKKLEHRAKSSDKDGDVEEDDEEDNEEGVGILTGTKRRKLESLHPHHHHHHHRHSDELNPKKKHMVIARLLHRVRDGVLGKNRNRHSVSS